MTGAWHHDAWWGWGHGMGLWELLWSLLWLAFWVVVVVVIIRVLRTRPASAPPRRETPALRVLEERYARGEITREEFMERRSILRGETPSPPPGQDSPTQEL